MFSGINHPIWAYGWCSLHAFTALSQADQECSMKKPIPLVEIIQLHNTLTPALQVEIRRIQRRRLVLGWGLLVRGCTTRQVDSCRAEGERCQRGSLPGPHPNHTTALFFLGGRITRHSNVSLIIIQKTGRGE